MDDILMRSIQLGHNEEILSILKKKFEFAAHCVCCFTR
jgi:hypothetical protein